MGKVCMEKDGELGSAQRPGETVEGQQTDGVICLKLAEGSGGDEKASPFPLMQMSQGSGSF